MQKMKELFNFSFFKQAFSSQEPREVEIARRFLEDYAKRNTVTIHVDTLVYFDGKNYKYIYGTGLQQLRDTKQITELYQRIVKNPDAVITRLDICVNFKYKPEDTIDIMAYIGNAIYKGDFVSLKKNAFFFWPEHKIKARKRRDLNKMHFDVSEIKVDPETKEKTYKLIGKKFRIGSAT